MVEYVERGPITEIAIQALESYKEAEMQNIWECSGKIAEDSAELEKAVADRINDVRSIPAADVVEVVRGKWINGNCDQCGAHAPFWCMASTYYTSNFCPNCGADMKETGR